MEPSDRSPQEPSDTSTSASQPPPSPRPRGRKRSAAHAFAVRLRRVGRGLLNRWSGLRPAQQLVLGFASYVLIGTLLLMLPASTKAEVHPLDHLFNVTSAVSTTGLTTVSVADDYSRLGQWVLLILFQLGGIGYMTVSSLIILARGGKLSAGRLGVLRAGFALPHYFVPQRFLRHVAVFTIAVEAVGTLVLWWRFSVAGVQDPLWSAFFHTVSAFATAGFSLNNNSLESFRGDWIVNLTVSTLCYLGAIGFIVVQDVWYSIKLRERMLTLTSKVILTMTAAIFLVGTVLLFFIEPSVRTLPFGERVLVSAFQVMTASSTAGFNTVPIGGLTAATLVIISVAMLIGASPSGTGGGVKTTSVSALLGNLISILRSRDRVVWLGPTKCPWCACCTQWPRRASISG
jgi:trk system potassium uptake protein TrkH